MIKLDVEHMVSVFEGANPFDCPLKINECIRRMRGGSQSVLVRCEDNHTYVLKLRNNPQGPNVLANEALTAYLLNAFKLPVPSYRTAWIDESIIRKFPMLYIEGVGSRTPPVLGRHFLSHFMGDGGVPVYEWAPKRWKPTAEVFDALVGIYIFDIWANHRDIRQSVYQKSGPEEFSYKPTFIDNGHMFGGPKWLDLNSTNLGQWKAPIRVPGPKDPAVRFWLKTFKHLLPELVHIGVSSIPAEWYRGNIRHLEESLLLRLEELDKLFSESSIYIKSDPVTRVPWLKSA